MAAPVIVRDADVDDDGSNTTGTVRNNAWKTAIYNRIDAVIAAIFGAGVVQTTTLTGAQADFALSANCTQLRLNNATDVTLSGFAAGGDGQVVRLVSIGAGNVYLKHQNAGSAAANRLINVATSGDTPLAAGSGTAEIQYDATTARWRLVAHEQGAWLTPTYAAGDFTASGSMTWTVDAGDIAVYRFWLKGKTLFVDWSLQTTSVGGTVSTGLYLKVPGGFTVANQSTAGQMYKDNGGAYTFAAAWCTPAAATVIQLYVAGFGSANWTLSTNNTATYGGLAIEVT